ncbi:MAG: periplasmic heavy metal sensor [Salinivirgaceae bacterium]|nr:periplasmic heavy metal sensor [Salinivirgaceae bacterium]
MDIIKRNRILTWTVIVLLITNLGIIGTIWYQSIDYKKNVNLDTRNRRNERNNGKFLIDELNLNNEQINYYKQSKSKHYTDIQVVTDSIRSYKRKIHDELFKKDPDTQYIQHLTDSIGRLNAEFEKLNYAHFLELKEFLNKEQLMQLKEIMNNKSFTGDRHKHRHRNNKRN